MKILSPTEWCDPHPSGGTYVWMPPPAAAPAAIEWLGHSIHKRPDSVHIVLVPRLMTALWQKRLSKTSDLLFTIPVVSKVVWPLENHEPLMCAVCSPLSRDSPWRHRGLARVKGGFKRLSPLWEAGVAWSAVRWSAPRISLPEDRFALWIPWESIPESTDTAQNGH